VEVVNRLIQAGGEVNKQDGKGSTPLHPASDNGHVEVITALLAAGADKTIKNGDGKTPHDLARRQDCKNALEHPTLYQLLYASKNGQVEVVKKLIQAGGEVNKKEEVNGFTPLHLASENGHLEVVKILIKAGGEVNAPIKDGLWKGETPLHRASLYGHVEVITALLAAGADKTLKDKWGDTPHAYAKNQDCKNALE